MDNPDNAARWADNIEPRREKQLYTTQDEAGRRHLVFGNNSYSIHNPKTKAAMRAEFVKWATTNKNYQVYIKNDELNIPSLDRVWEKEFKLGSVVSDGTKTY